MGYYKRQLIAEMDREDENRQAAGNLPKPAEPLELVPERTKTKQTQQQEAPKSSS
jgi:hypothetical protein